MAPGRKVTCFQREGNDWFCNAGLPSDVNVIVDGINFHLHKFPLVSRCGRIARICEESSEKTFTMVLDEFPGGPDTFLLVIKFCYGLRVDLTPRNVVLVYCASDYLEMTNEFGEGNLLHKSESYLHKNVVHNWKDCIVALQTAYPVLPRAEKLQIVDRCLDALSMMVFTDRSLFGWPMMMYDGLQSPGGSILWNGIETGARISSTESGWWSEDISFLSVCLFERLVIRMERRGIGPENLVDAIMHYARRYLPGLGRWWQSDGQSGKGRTVTGFSLTPAAVDQKVLLETIVKLLPEVKGKSICRFLLGLLRVALILDVSQGCKDSLERKIGMQLDEASLDGLLIPTYANYDTLYDTDCVKRIINHFISSEARSTSLSPLSLDLGTHSSSDPLMIVAKLIDNYLAEVASDVNLKPKSIKSLADSLPASSRRLHDGLYRALDIYFKAHPWLSEKEKEELCNIIDYRRLSIDACTHASQNGRLPIRVILQVLFFEQMQLRTALAGCLHTLDTENPAAGPITLQGDTTGHVLQRDGWATVVRENRDLKIHMENTQSRVQELEEEFSRMKQELKRVTKSHSTLSSPRSVAQKIGRKLFPRPSISQPATVTSSVPTPRASAEQACPLRLSRHRRSLSLF